MTGGMNDNDVDDLARVLADTLPDSGDHCFDEELRQCDPEMWAAHEEDREHYRKWAREVLASGVVVSARDVKALPARLATKLCDCFGPVDDPDEHDDECAGVDAGLALRVLLREPATDAAPTGETQGGDDDTDLIWSLAQLVATHTPALVNEGPNGEDDGQHYYCVACGVLPPDTWAGEHVAVLTLAAIRDAVSLPEGGEQRG